MKIAVISATQVPSIAANSIQVMKVAQAFTQIGHEVVLLVPGQAPAAWEELSALYGLEDRFEVAWLPASPRLKRYDFAWKALNWARKQRMETIYTWMLQTAVIGLYKGFPVLLEMHDRPTGRNGPLFFRQFWSKPGRKRMLPITRALARILEQEYGLAFPPAQVVVSPDGVDIERYRGLPAPQEARAQLGLPEGVTAGYSGHFYPGRGMDLVFSLAQNNPEIRFLWMGGRPDDVSDWRQQVSDAGLANVSLTGFIENQRLPLYQAAADILLMPYGKAIAGSSGGNIAEVYSPMKMFEYLATGRAILTSDLPVLREVLNEENAVFCPPEDPAMWESNLRRLAEDAELRQRLGCQARQDAEQYTWKARAAQALEGF